MLDPLLRTEVAFNECESHLRNTGAFGSPIESYLTDHILILLCADMQQALYRIADQRARRSSDPALHEFVSAASARILRSVRKDEIATFIGLFGANYKSKFNDSLNDRDVTVYNNAVSERHNVAHRQGSTIAFMELREAIATARKILAAVEGALA